MAPKEKVQKSNIDNAEHRSAYGDMQAHREAQMMQEHVALLRGADKIDEHMATELLKPLDRKREYTAEYLSNFLNYTGVQPPMASLETADKNRRKRDREMLKIVQDFEAGRIDEHGSRIVEESDEDASEDDSVASQLADDSEPEEERVDVRPAMSGKTLALRFHTFSLTPALESSASPPAPPSPESASPSAQPAAAQPPKRKRRRPEKVDPLTPLPGGKTYEGYSYNQLAAAGRERGIYTPGGAQSIRNALIQDDINVAQGLKRNIAGWKKKANMNKTFKTSVPEELRTKVPEPEGDREGDEDED
ncbi:uncharacterized protein M421DRAFT_172112 [Didymella exigua CBS 183.55]|uniref:Uncharacterized protein n=1 Tax=Didymella exigua CBS 183.55 TaxID=1150837 RepID=A0A6A5RKY9_9PLEO|nr:uncharacterized protein M421DRAFT_172112 [Didymella exigua CBS 183.55]KAF1927644.1 hypothetical protein M421DRAFT_172112 [Didymella exigua CBS 183.55]